MESTAFISVRIDSSLTFECVSINGCLIREVKMLSKYCLKSPHQGCFVWLCRFRDHVFRNFYVLLFSLHHLQLCRMLKTCWMNPVALRGLMESSSTSFYSKLCLVRYRLVKNHRDIFTGEPWLLHLLYSVSSQRQRCRPPSALRSWAREAAPQLVLETTRAPLPAVLVFLITVAQMQVGAFIPQQHCCFFIREGMTTPTSSLFYCEVNILSTVWKYLKFKSVCYVIVETSLVFAFYCTDVCVCMFQGPIQRNAQSLVRS